MAKWESQDDNPDAVVKVSSGGVDRQSGRPVASEFIVQSKSGRRDHVHVGFDENGDQTFEARRYASRAPLEDQLRLLNEARALAGRQIDKNAISEAKRLRQEWRAIGYASKENNEAFNTAIDAVFTANRERIERTKAEWERNRAAKERLVSEAESVANASDLKSARERMRRLGEEWKAIGPCDRKESDRLWNRLNAARSRLRERSDREFEKRKAEFASNKQAKERLVSQMNALSRSSDLRAAKDEARRLNDQWRTIGHCEKADADRLWNEFKTAKDRLFDAARQEGERRKAEAHARASERVQRLREQLQNVEAAMRRADEAYSRASMARSPSMRNPNWYAISQNQRERVDRARQRQTDLSIRRGDVLRKLMEAESRLNQF